MFLAKISLYLLYKKKRKSEILFELYLKAQMHMLYFIPMCVQYIIIDVKLFIINKAMITTSLKLTGFLSL